MCGIAGFLRLDGRSANRNDLVAMTDLLRHRGPDGGGVHIDGTLGLGHRRLSILDLSPLGAQPMISACGRYVVTFNGEIYNFVEIRAELEQAGHQFRSDSDTEVLLAAYAQWGIDCQNRFNGMWAFALWDREQRTLFLSRDRFGVKPLFYLETDAVFAFASEMKVFLAIANEVPLRFDADIVALSFLDSLRIEGTERTLLHRVRRLPAGHCLVLREGRSPSLRRWWNTLDHLPDLPADRPERAAMLRALLADSCRLRMRSDVRIGSALSGGLDSGSVHMMLADIGRNEAGRTRIADDWQRAFVAHFPGHPMDELAAARVVIAAAKSTEVVVPIDLDAAVDRLDSYCFQMEEITDCALAVWLLYEAMSRLGVRVSLDGHGGDEAFGGYHHHVRTALEHETDAGRRAELAEQYSAMQGSTVPAPTGRSFRISDFIPDRPAYPALSGRDRDFPRFSGWAPVSRQIFSDFHYTLLPTNLRDFDRCSMAHGVEVRAPLLDWRLVTFAFALPVEDKISGGWTKRLLREAMQGLLPDEIRLQRRKIGFATPIPARIPRFQSLMLDIMTSRRFREADLWDGASVAKEAIHRTAVQDTASLSALWYFLQADRLMDTFSAEHAKQKERQNRESQ